ncbi:hypothetical protein J7E96_35720 [Streptomyces sp. ISL-96]|uniref:hypothetical protein n=1 Tax=Streptomyces sp. ISL-96 TaxID=2819191 RepID=UPI001BEA975B|nr:hypothetical protein [Streptomyces sp. ISL-96]MBT2493754.1 hypothetical protein [Streptomyces sp. ISL-96]
MSFKFLMELAAWDFYRGEAPAPELIRAVTEQAPRELGPLCTCGLPHSLVCRFCGADMGRHCYRHDVVEPHRCRAAG